MKVIKKLFLSLIKYFNSHIKYQLFFSYISVIISIMLILTGVVYYFVPKIIAEKYYQNINELNQQIILNFDNSLFQMEQISLMISFESDLKIILDSDNKGNISSSQYQNIDKYFFDFVYSFQQLHGVYIYNLNGENVFIRNINQAFHTNEPVNDEEWFKNAISKKGIKTVLGKHRNEYINDKTEVISLYRAVVSTYSSEVLGVIVIEKDIKDIGKIIDSFDKQKKSVTVILDDKNQLVYSNNILFYKEIEILDEFQKKSAEIKNGSYEIGNKNTRNYINQNYMDKIGWKILIIEPYNDLMREVIIIKNIVNIAFFICLLVTFVVSVFISGRISSKLVKMKNVVENVKMGNLNTKIQVSGTDEIAELAIGFNSMVMQLKNLIEKEYKEKILRREAELNLLQEQINPHFLYNALGSIKNLANEEGSLKSAMMIQSLANIFRYNLGRRNNIATIGEEVENIKNYLLLQQYRFADKIKVVYEIDDDILNEEIALMTLQPIVENSIIHGIEPKSGKGILKIKGFHSGGCNFIEVIDNGVGITIEKNEDINSMLENYDQDINNSGTRSIGLSNVNSRLKYMFGGQYGVKIIKNADEGVTVRIIAPSSYND